VGTVLSAAIAHGPPILERRWTLLGLLGLWGVSWVVGVMCARRLAWRVAVPAALVIGVAMRVVALAGPPAISDDLFRYAWDGRVQDTGVDPYRYPPSAPQLAHLREPWLWPGPAECAALHRPPDCTLVNRPAVRTIYPPAAEGWFWLVYRLGGLGLRHRLWQLAGLATELAVLAVLPFALRAWRRDLRWVALYALSPVAAVEVVNNGHVDGLAALFVVVALWVAGSSGRHRRAASGWAGAALGVAALIKLYPAVLAAGLANLSSQARSRWVRLSQSAGAVGATVAVGYLPHVLAVGTHVLGYLPGYLREERYVGGDRFLLLGTVAPWRGLTFVLAGLAAVGLLLLVWRGAADPPKAMALLFGGLLLVATPVQPWYTVALLAVATVAGQPVWAVVAAAGYPYYWAVVLDHPRAVLIGRLSYGLALVVVGVVVVVVWAGTGRRMSHARGLRPAGLWRGSGGTDWEERSCECW
jgi:hypothetical protein